MTILIALLIIAAASCYFFVFRASARWNADPRQQELAQMLMRTAGHDGHYIRDQDIVSCFPAWVAIERSTASRSSCPLQR
jgi:hypothetical protein